LENAVHVQPLRLLEVEQFPPLVGRPDFIPHEISNPDPQVGGMSRKGHPLLALAQSVRQSRRAQHVLAQFVAHRRHDGQKGETDQIGEDGDNVGCPD
jgi:hypothetical protein